MRYFSAPDDAQLVLDTLRLVRETHPFRMLGYVVMPDHVHLLLHLGDTGISDLMHAFKRQVTHNYRAAHPDCGNLQLWQKGVWDHLVLHERELDPILAYIHYNPVKHGVVQDAAGYRFSSLKAYEGRAHGWAEMTNEPGWAQSAEP